MTTILDRRAGQALKEQGQQLAFDYSGPWQAEVLDELRGWLAIQKARGFTTVTIEQFRAEAKSHPISTKSWGALPRIAMKAGLIAPTDRYVKAAAVKTHGHPVRVWALV